MGQSDTEENNYALVLIYGSKYQDHMKKICRGDGTLTEHVM